MARPDSAKSRAPVRRFLTRRRPIVYIRFFDSSGKQRHGATVREEALARILRSFGTLVEVPLEGTGARKVLHPRNAGRLAKAFALIARGGARCVVVSFPYLVPAVAAAARISRTPLILDAHNVEAERLSRLGHRAGGFLRHWEPLAARAADAVFCVSEDDAQALRRAGAKKTYHVPNGADLSRFQQGRASPWKDVAGSRPVLFFFGDERYAPNQEAAGFLREVVAPALAGHPKRPVVAVSGRHDQPAQWLAPNVYATGRVPAIEPFVSAATAILVPLTHGAGTHLKVVESLAAGQVILTTPEGLRGLDLEPGRDVLVSPRTGFVGAIEALLDREDLEAIRTRARAAAARYDWDVIAQTVRAAINELAPRT